MPQFLLDFRSLRAFNPRTFSERRSFRPAARPARPEANARQRDAPSGAKVFGITITGSVAEAPSRTQVKRSSPATGSLAFGEPDDRLQRAGMTAVTDDLILRSRAAASRRIGNDTTSPFET